MREAAQSPKITSHRKRELYPIYLIKPCANFPPEIDCHIVVVKVMLYGISLSAINTGRGGRYLPFVEIIATVKSSIQNFILE